MTDAAESEARRDRNLAALQLALTNDDLLQIVSDVPFCPDLAEFSHLTSPKGRAPSADDVLPLKFCADPASCRCEWRVIVAPDWHKKILRRRRERLGEKHPT